MVEWLLIIMSEKIFDNLEEAMYEFIFYEKINLIRLRRPKTDENDNSSIIHNFPSEKGIIVKTVFEINEMGRRFPNKTFYDYNPENFDEYLENMDKKSITKILKDHLIEYFKNNRSRNNYFNLIEKSIIKKNNAVKYELKLSDYVSFNIQIDPSDLNVENVSEYITSLPVEKLKEEKEIQESSDSWKVETAKSSRAACRTCGEKIQKQTIRIGQPSYYEGHLSYKWFHLSCVKSFDESYTLDGLEDLEQEEQVLVKEKLFGSKTDKHKSKEGEISPDISKPIDEKKVILKLIDQYQVSEGLTAERDVYKFAKEKGIQESKSKELIIELEEEGQLYRPDTGKLKLV